MVFDRLKTYFLQRWTSGFVIVFRRADGTIVVNAGLLSAAELRNLAVSLRDAYCARSNRDRLRDEAEAVVREARQLIHEP